MVPVWKARQSSGCNPNAPPKPQFLVAAEDLAFSRPCYKQLLPELVIFSDANSQLHNMFHKFPVTDPCTPMHLQPCCFWLEMSSSSGVSLAQALRPSRNSLRVVFGLGRPERRRCTIDQLARQTCVDVWRRCADSDRGEVLTCNIELKKRF